jgi:hypothetical protein
MESGFHCEFTHRDGKFWPGTSSGFLNRAMVVANSLTAGSLHRSWLWCRCGYGITLLQASNVGPQIGYNMMDNGYASFDHVAIPRHNMAMRFRWTTGSFSKGMSEASQGAHYHDGCERILSV